MGQQIAVTHEEADVIMIYLMIFVIYMYTAVHLHIKVIYDGMDVLYHFHHLHAQTSGSSETLELIMESCVGMCTVININVVIAKQNYLPPILLDVGQSMH